ncbi:MAG: indole-3-glycerol phosphate synthase TrpC [Prolixibacteraceae bacterium]|nr:indole-3-glycerol phosphate synthase TrpC [Prolixibacteraceae bacterium]
MMTILDEINAHKRLEVEKQKVSLPLDELKKHPAYNKSVPSLKAFLLSGEKTGIIAEFKRKSPSKGTIYEKAKPDAVVNEYEMAGASGVSVLTDTKYFGGTLNDLQKAASLLHIPVLRKDFMIDEYQVHEAKAYGAAVILLIAASISVEKIDQLAGLAHELGMEVLFEIHCEEELNKVSSNVDIVGVNNRDLKTFTVDINQSIKLAEKIPSQFMKISESGISNPETVKMLKTFGYQGFLMGENFMKETDPGEAFRRFVKKLKAHN